MMPSVAAEPSASEKLPEAVSQSSRAFARFCTVPVLRKSGYVCGGFEPGTTPVGRS
jgi:hypothetical protein